MKSVNFRVCILKIGVCSVFEFLACEGMNGTTNLAVVDLSPYGFVFEELALQTLILNDFLNFLFFGSFVTLQIISDTPQSFCTHQNHNAQTRFMGGSPPHGKLARLNAKL